MVKKRNGKVCLCLFRCLLFNLSCALIIQEVRIRADFVQLKRRWRILTAPISVSLRGPMVAGTQASGRVRKCTGRASLWKSTGAGASCKKKECKPCAVCDLGTDVSR